MFLLFSFLLTTMTIHEFAVLYLEEDLLQGDLDLDREYGEREQDLRWGKDLDLERVLWDLWEDKDLGGDTESLHGELKEEQEGDTSNNE